MKFSLGLMILLSTTMALAGDPQSAVSCYLSPLSSFGREKTPIQMSFVNREYPIRDLYVGNIDDKFSIQLKVFAQYPGNNEFQRALTVIDSMTLILSAEPEDIHIGVRATGTKISSRSTIDLNGQELTCEGHFIFEKQSLNEDLRTRMKRQGEEVSHSPKSSAFQID